jgi:hypothetical protein
MANGRCGKITIRKAKEIIEVRMQKTKQGSTVLSERSEDQSIVDTWSW